MSRLPISALEKENKNYDENIIVTTITYENKDHEILFYPLFKFEKIRKLILELGQFYNNAEKEKVNIDPIEEEHLINYFIIKHFSKGLKFTSSKKAKTIYNEFKTIYNSSLYRIFKEEVFPEELVQNSIEEVYNEFFNNLELADKFSRKLEKAKQSIENLPLENKELLKMAFENIGNKKVEK